jgi:hypothetical protein
MTAKSVNPYDNPQRADRGSAAVFVGWPTTAGKESAVQCAVQ